MSLDGVCLSLLNSNVCKDDKVLIIFENSKSDICNSFLNQFDKTMGEDINHFNLDSLKRPISKLPSSLIDEISNSNLVLLLTDKYANKAFDEFLTVRAILSKLKSENNFRLGTLLSVNSDFFEEIFSYSPEEIKILNDKLFSLITSSNHVKITTTAGTDLSLDIDTSYTWINQDADLSSPSPQHSLLAGEVYGYPVNVNGTLVVDGVMGGSFMKYDLTKTPLTIEIINSKISKFDSKNRTLVTEFQAHLNKHENADKVGELGFGTNIALTKFYNILGIDEKFPGNHIAFGHPYSKKTGAKWSSNVHIDCVIRKATTWVGKTKVLESGKYLI